MKNFELSPANLRVQSPHKSVLLFSLLFPVPWFSGDLCACTHILLILSLFVALIFILDSGFRLRDALIRMDYPPGIQRFGFQDCPVVLSRDAGEFH